ncbi:MAG TPA: hypothetical protein VF110_03950 [Burkholderiales bacterium]|jgi:hypothetical protein
MRLRALFAAALATAALAGCAQLMPGADVDTVVAEALNAARAPAAEQKAALARAQDAFTSSTGDLNRLRLATLLVALPAPLRDDARAIELLEPLADAASPGTGRFAALLTAQAAERQRLVRENAREAERQAKERGAREAERLALDKERDKREEALRQQLEALRAIERGILEREEKLRRRQK